MAQAHKNRLIYGALIGDFGGSLYDSSFAPASKLPLLPVDVYGEKSHFTAATVMTLAVANAFATRTDLTVSYRYYASRFPEAGYGKDFTKWLWDDDLKAYGSKGIGAAMRVSPVAYFAKSEEECLELAAKTSLITHNSIEGLTSAQTTALLIYKALHGSTKEELLEEAKKRYPSLALLELEDLHKTFKASPLAEENLPVAFYAFFSSKDFADCLHRVAYIGGASSSIGSIALALASAYYKKISALNFIPVLDSLPSEFISLLEIVPLPIEVEEEDTF